MTTRFTLISFHCDEIDLDDPQRGGKTDLFHILEATKGQRVKLYLGAYVFDTKKDWQNMHLLCEWLRTRRRSFLRLPFEEELFVYTTPAIAKELNEMGVKTFQYPEESPSHLYR